MGGQNGLKNVGRNQRPEKTEKIPLFFENKAKALPFSIN
jgi:hypothetical protein